MDPPSAAIPAGGKSPSFLVSLNGGVSCSSFEVTHQCEIVIVVVHTVSRLSWNLDVDSCSYRGANGITYKQK